MKKLITLIAFTVISVSTFAQSVDLRRKIEVTGVAEQSVTPDIINVSITLQEYLNGKTKVTIEQLEQQLESAVKDAGIAKDDFTINNISAWNNSYQKKKAVDFLASKQYNIKFHDLDRFNVILAAIDPKGIQATNIDSYDYSKMEQLKNQLKVKALLAAKEKATYLLSAIGDKVGDALNITETDNSNFPQPRAMMMFKSAAAQAVDVQPSDIDFKQIKLSFTIDAVFEIVK